MMQHTIAGEIELSGIGLHTGNLTNMVLKPAAENSGIKFIRTDLPGSPVISACCQNVMGTIRGTMIGVGNDAVVYTIEHLLSAFHGMGIDNVEVRLDNNEPPIFDGSARVFVDSIQNAGIQEQKEKRKYYRLTDTVGYVHGHGANAVHITAYPSEILKLEYSMFYDHPLVGEQNFIIEINKENYLKEICDARTFCFDYEIETLKKEGLGRGGLLNNTVVIALDKIHAEDKLRYTNEFVRHKVLDMIGDFYLLGMPLKARVLARRTGHKHNVNFIKKLKGGEKNGRNF